MTSFSRDSLQSRQIANARALIAFGEIVSPTSCVQSMRRVIHAGRGPTIFTVGYERRDGEGLAALLVDVGVTHLADIRERAFSRKPDFRSTALQRVCKHAGLQYSWWPKLGSTGEQRDELHATGDIVNFMREFRQHAASQADEVVEQLGHLAKSETIALLCYERCHHECHRSVIAEMLHEKIDASIVALT